MPGGVKVNETSEKLTGTPLEGLLILNRAAGT